MFIGEDVYLRLTGPTAPGEFVLIAGKPYSVGGVFPKTDPKSALAITLPVTVISGAEAHARAIGS